ncbi:SRPBCC domain-containing protein [Streptomyces sp. YS415]|uniref:SRPBCC domain-containing protein n=1 Tax=Streptomyces sp. YS415 TaxID=2944806 RepID=UPI002021D528|nr:SRPBCC domain-containing protein [Streptomyces sp. YS415]MCL7428833.1 SRPBCC domain-containing protein [Streptomyces sp. YS415]
MELDVFVPVATARLREALSDPARVARALPGLQQDAGAGTPMSGRLKVRVGGHTITYRGALRMAPREDGGYAVEGEATEARGTGSVKLSLTLRVSEAEDGSTLTFDATAKADGRITQLPPDQVDSAMTRLLHRFAENLATTQSQPEHQPTRPAPQAPENPEPAQPETAQPETTEPAAPEPEATEPEAAEPAAPETPEPAAADVPETPPGPPPAAEAEETSQAAPEAAHARRTMIGRSAEEVDHAPPRGRYAPVPAPQSSAPASALRWAAPAAALAVASAIVVSRALRRRR